MVIATIGIETTRVRSITTVGLKNYTFENKTEYLSYGGAEEVLTQFVTNLNTEYINKKDFIPDLDCDVDKFALNCLPQGKEKFLKRSNFLIKSASF